MCVCVCVLKGCVSFFLRAPLMCAETGNNQKGFKGLRKVFFPLEVTFRGNVNYVLECLEKRPGEKKYTIKFSHVSFIHLQPWLGL